MIDQFPFYPFCSGRFPPGDSNQEFRQLIGFAGKDLSRLLHIQIVAKEGGVVVFDHVRARTGRHHHIIKWRQKRNMTARQFPGAFLIPAVVIDLAATGLAARNRDLKSGFYQQAFSRPGDRWTP